MKKMLALPLACAAAAWLAGCGGSGTGDQSPRIAFTRMVNFGDSLSDVGTYATKLVADSGGGEYSINGDLSKAGFPYTNWSEYLAATLQLPAPCPNEVGLDSVGQLSFLAQTPAIDASCFSYAQGGARVTNPYGPGNKYYYEQFGDPSGQLGQLTKPVVQQVSDFLAANMAFSATDLVTVLAGGNDLFIDRALDVDAVVAQLVAQGLIGTTQGNQAIVTASQKAVDDMTAAGTQLADLVVSQVIANGAKYVAVLNLPDISQTPDTAIWETQGAGVYVEPLHPHLVLDMVDAFNTALAAGLGVANGVSSQSEVAYVDLFTASLDDFADPAQFGITVTSGPACDLTKTGVNLPGFGLVPIATSLLCTRTTLLTDPSHETSMDPTGVLHYFFADDVHPTPLGYQLIDAAVARQMAIQGWL